MEENWRIAVDARTSNRHRQDRRTKDRERGRKSRCVSFVRRESAWAEGSGWDWENID